MTYKIGGQTLVNTAALVANGRGNERDKFFPKNNTVSIQVGEGESPVEIHRRFLLEAASQAGLDGTNQQTEFVAKYIGKSLDFANFADDPSKNDGAAVKQGELVKGTASYTLDNEQVKYLKQLQTQYVADGRKLRRGKSYSAPQPLASAQTNPKQFNAGAVVKINLQKLADQAEVLTSKIGLPTDPNELKSFFVNLSNAPNLSREDDALLALIKSAYAGGNLNITHFQEILSLAKEAGVKVQNLQVTGNSARFDLSAADVLKVKIARISVQEKANRVERIYRDAMNNNEISAFVRGVIAGGYKSAAGTVGLITDLPGTMQALWQIVSNPVETFNALYKELGETWDEFKNAPPNKKSEMVGELVGAAIVEILLGKGIGKAGSILARTKTGTEILEKAKAVKLATTAKAAETFSDEAAALASQRAKQRLATQLYSGIPADVLANMAVFAGNKIKNGAVKFGEFSRLMVDEFGEKVRPKMLELYQESFEKVFGRRKDLTLDELLGGHTIERHVGKSDNWLRKRLTDDFGIPSASTFTNEAIANRTIARFVKEKREAIEEWLESGKHRLDVEFEMNEPVGRVLTRGKGNASNSKPIETDKVIISIIRNNTPQGWHVNTSFPIDPKGGFRW